MPVYNVLTQSNDMWVATAMFSPQVYSQITLVGDGFEYSETGTILGGFVTDWLHRSFYVSDDGSETLLRNFEQSGLEALENSDFSLLSETGGLSISAIFLSSSIALANLVQLHPDEDHSPFNIVQSFSGETSLLGADQNDILIGSADALSVSGFHGDDYLATSAEEAVVKGGVGNDVLEFREDGFGRLVGGAGADTLIGGNGHDSLFGGAGSDVLSAAFGNNRLVGGSGSDMLVSGSGDDRLIGGDGRDFINGGSGKDTVSGGDGADAFFLALNPEYEPFLSIESDLVGTTTIIDFDASEGDMLFIRESDNGYTEGVDRFENFHEHAIQKGASVVYNDGNSQVVFRNTDLSDFGEEVFVGDNISFSDWLGA